MREHAFKMYIVIVNKPFRELGGNLHNVVLLQKTSYICVLRKTDQYQLSPKKSYSLSGFYPSNIPLTRLNFSASMDEKITIVYGKCGRLNFNLKHF